MPKCKDCKYFKESKFIRREGTGYCVNIDFEDLDNWIDDSEEEHKCENFRNREDEVDNAKV